MNTNDTDQTKLVILTPLGNTLASYKDKTFNQEITVASRNAVSSIPVVRTYGKDETCYVWGDPHVISFDSQLEMALGGLVAQTWLSILL
jgi:hypothetical protein